MKVQLLGDISGDEGLAADLVIVGGGPTGLTIARECAATGKKIIIVESGLADEDQLHENFNQVQSVGAPTSGDEIAKRRRYHSANAKLWSHEIQPYGVRCRALGGSTHAWAGKSAPFAEIDFEERAWVPRSGWPLTYEEMAAYLERAVARLNLSPASPKERFRTKDLASFYWQFARSRLNHVDAMRFGVEFLREDYPNITLVLDATVTRLTVSDDNSRFEAVHLASAAGAKTVVRAPLCVLAASSIENARLLLASDDVVPGGIGNQHDHVGRYLMDHVGCEIGRVAQGDVSKVWREFGFFNESHGNRSHLFMHGLTLTPDAQARDKLLHAAVYFVPQLAPDDPWPALKRLLSRKSEAPLSDALTLLRGGRYLLLGVGMQLLSSPRFPSNLKEFIVNLAIRFNPNLVAEEFLAQGLPRKLQGVAIEAICEQLPNPDSRITLSGDKDQFGTPLAQINWQINPVERETLLRLAQTVEKALIASDLPGPKMEDWVDREDPQRAIIIDMAHTLGTTRMSVRPEDGVVDPHCQVHGVSGLYIGGGSVFPTSGHVNPTLMILAIAIRLADELKMKLSEGE